MKKKPVCIDNRTAQEQETDTMLDTFQAIADMTLEGWDACAEQHFVVLSRLANKIMHWKNKLPNETFLLFAPRFEVLSHTISQRVAELRGRGRLRLAELLASTIPLDVHKEAALHRMGIAYSLHHYRCPGQALCNDRCTTCTIATGHAS